MPRRLRISSGEHAYHVLNRAVGRMRIFGKQRDFEAFEEVSEQAKAWRWSSHWRRLQGNKSALLVTGPVALPRKWLQHLQTRPTEAELETLRRSVVRGSPFGEAPWQERTAKRLGLQSSLHTRGRPCKTRASLRMDPRNDARRFSCILRHGRRRRHSPACICQDAAVRKSAVLSPHAALAALSQAELLKETEGGGVGFGGLGFDVHDALAEELTESLVQ
jgi:hypothetical protein